MSPSTALTTKVESGSPYQLSSEQVLKASTALIAHTKSLTNKQNASKNSLVDSTEEEDPSDSPIVWLLFTTKKHIVEKKALKPKKLTVPHSLISPAATICLIVADPQRTFKDIVASPAFPAELAKRITRVIGLSKLKKKFDRYEAQRQLKADHDVFLADDRVVTLLPRYLGKVFYKSTVNRPIPVHLMATKSKEDGKTVRRKHGEEKESSPPAKPEIVAANIEKALASAQIHLTPSTSTAVRVGNTRMSAVQLKENVEAVVEQVVNGVVPKKWRGVRGIHVKSAKSASLPVWLADELWVDEREVLDGEAVEELRAREANVGKKRKALTTGAEIDGEGDGEKKKKKQKVLKESNDDKLDEEIKARKERLRKQKEEAAGEVEDDVPKPSKKGKKSKA